jgi:hypothetical protein
MGDVDALLAGWVSPFEPARQNIEGGAKLATPPRLRYQRVRLCGKQTPTFYISISMLFLAPLQTRHPWLKLLDNSNEPLTDDEMLVLTKGMVIFSWLFVLGITVPWGTLGRRILKLCTGDPPSPGNQQKPVG